MGKKSKRARSAAATKAASGGEPAGTAKREAERLLLKEDNVAIVADEQEEEEPKRAPPAARVEEEETADNLRFQDPYVDEYESEEEYGDEGEEEDKEIVKMKGGEDDDGDDDDAKPSAMMNVESPIEVIQSWHPLAGAPLEKGQTLEIDDSAYKMHHALTAEWPSLSFDFVPDHFGSARTRFPHSVTAVVGTQADSAERNRITVMRLSDLCRTGNKEKTEDELDDEMLGDAYDPDNDDDDSGSDSDEEEEETDLDPVLEHYHLRHPTGGVNRVRVMPQNPSVVAAWSDGGIVSLYDVGGILDALDRSAGINPNSNTSRKVKKEAFFQYSGHGAEGYAVDWSPVEAGRMATGDCNGDIHVWNPAHGVLPGNVSGGEQAPNDDIRWSSSSWTVTPSYAAHGENLDNPSVEDVQWSPSEGTVFATAECGGLVRVYDVRAPHRSMLSNKIHPNGADVNVLAWNKLVSNLLATGGDDGTFAVWDLRNFQSGGDSGSGGPPKPLARFGCHKTPITSLEWHPTDESMIVVSDDAAAYVYDLSVEEDEPGESSGDDAAGGGGGETHGGNNAGGGGGIPPQMLFAHCGSELVKEARWHPQVSSCLMTTALNGFGVFIPSNL